MKCFTLLWGFGGESKESEKWPATRHELMFGFIEIYLLSLGRPKVQQSISSPMWPAAAVGYKKEQQQQPTSWSRLSTFRRNVKFHNYSKVSLWADDPSDNKTFALKTLGQTDDDDGKPKNWSAIDINYVNRKLSIADAYNYRMFSDAEGLFFRCECCGSAQLPQ